MAYVEVDASEVRGLAKLFGKAASKMPKKRKEALQQAGKEFVGHMKETVKPVKWRGELEQSMSILEIDEDHVVIGPDMGVAPHAKYVRHGTPPHAAPFDKIYEWTASKLGGTEEDAWAIWWSIREFGTSQWAAREFGTSGDFPFPKMTLEKPESRKTLEDVANELGLSVVAEIT